MCALTLIAIQLETYNTHYRIRTKYNLLESELSLG